MSHEITIRDDGAAEAVYALQPAWHGLGATLDHAPTAEEAFRVANLNWEVNLKRVYIGGIGDNGENTYTSIPDRRATVRADTGKVLGIVSDHYKPFQNHEGFAFMDKLVNTGDVRYESAGSLKGGKLIWLLARLPNVSDTIVPGDDLNRYLLLFNSHDGSNAITILPTSVRVVCWNTLTAATPVTDEEGNTVSRGRRNKNIIRIKHSGSMQIKLDDARKILNTSNKVFDAFAEQARKLAHISITQAQFASFLERLIPTPGTGELTPSRRKSRARIIELYNEGKEQAMCRNTAWAAVNAVTHFIDHDWSGKAKDPTDRKSNTLYSRWFGQARGFKQEALKAANEIFATV